MDSEFLYHYTSANALISIILNRKMWASDIEYMNDSREGRVAKDILEDLIRKRQEFQKPLDDYVRGFIDWFLNSGRATFATSFSDSGQKNLTLFRTYGPADGGYNIGFPEDYLKSIPKVTFVKCVYDLELQRREVTDFFKNLIEVISDIRKQESNPIEARKVLSQNTDLWHQFAALNARFKPSEFESESESRICFYGVKKENVRYRASARGNVIIPYIEVELPNEPIEVAVNLGPNTNHGMALSSYQRLTYTATSSGCNWKFRNGGGVNSSFRFI